MSKPETFITSTAPLGLKSASDLDPDVIRSAAVQVAGRVPRSDVRECLSALGIEVAA